MALVLRVDEKPKSIGEWLLLSFQHIFASFSGIVTVPIIFASALGFDKIQTGEMIADILIVSGIVTIFQSKGVGFLGSRLPQVMGSNFTFIGPGLSIGLAASAIAGGSPEAGYAAILGASMLGSLVQIFLGGFTGKIRRIFPPIVQGIVVSLIGLTILGVAVDWFAGGHGAEDYDSITNIVLGLTVMFITIGLNQYGKGILSSGSIFFGIVVGYLLAFFMGKLDLSILTQTQSIYFPTLLKYGMTFKIEYVFPFAIAYLVAMVEATGDTLACAKVSEVDMKDNKRLSGSILLGGVGSFVGALFNATPTTTFSQNTGVVSITGVASRYVVMGSGALLIVMGLIPKIGALVSVMPQPVLGGAAIVMFGTIAAVGIGVFQEVEFNNGNMLIVGISISAGLAVTLRPQLLQNLPTFISTILSSGITTGTLVGVTMNLLFNGVEKQSDVEKDNIEIETEGI